MTLKYNKFLLSVLIILLFAGTASALPTTTHDTIRGEMYVSSTANWPSTYSTNNFDVPNGTVVFARYYVGVWASSGTPTSISTTFNGHAYETNPSYYTTEMGVTWIPYDITDYVLPGKKNTATINTKYWGDGRQYGSTLVVVLKNESEPQMEYWIAEGCDWLHYGDYVGYEASNSTTYFNGTVNLADVQSASLYSTHLTGYNYEDFNGKSLSNSADSVSGDYFNYIRWDNVKPSLVAENQTVNVGRGGDTYCSPVFHALSIVSKAPDLVPTSLTPSYVIPGTVNTMTATIENMGVKDSPSFNVSLIADGTVVDTQPIAGIASRGSATVDLQWTPTSGRDVYSLTVVADPDNEAVESEGTNNELTVLVSSTSTTVPTANFTAVPTFGEVPLTVNFTDQSSNSPISWIWDFDNDGMVDSTDQNISYTYSTAGNYTVNLTVTNGGGSDSEVKTEYIVAVDPLSADFTASSTSGYSPFEVVFTDTSTGLSTSWFWDFGDGENSTSQNPSHTYSTDERYKIYTVSLKVMKEGESDSITKENYITVSTSSGPVWIKKTEWNGPDIGQWASPCFADLDDDGDYDMLIGRYASGISCGYENKGTASSPVWTAKSEWNTPDVGTTETTLPKPFLVDLDGDADYDLLIGTIDGISYAYENIGNKSSPEWTAKSEWNAPDRGSGWCYVSPRLADLDNDADYDLLIGAANGVSYAYENTGNKSSPEWTEKTEWNTPGIGGSYASPCFADLDSDGDYDLLVGEKGGGTTYTYAYENTGNASGPEWTAKPEWNAPSIGSWQYASPASVDLDDDGDYDLLTGGYSGISYGYENTAPLPKTKPDLILSGIIPPSEITANNTCTIGATINNTGTGNEDAFNATLSVNGTVVNTQSISGSISDSSSKVNFTWTPEAAGDYNLTVTVDPENGITESDETNNELTVLVTASAASVSPVANFTADVTNGDAPLIVNFTGQSTGIPTSWLWDFGDGNSATSQNSSHTYSKPGTYTVNLTVTNAAGTNSTVKTDYITVSAVPGPVWTAKPEWNGGPASIGTAANPAFADLDDDGDYDLLIGGAGGYCYGYENIGNKISPSWTAKSIWNTPKFSSGPSPDFVDLDGDRDYDLLIGDSMAKLNGIENTGSATSPVWTKKSTWDMSVSGSTPNPAFADLDEDGDYDMLIGVNSYGNIYAYENTGTKNSPIWTDKSTWTVPDVIPRAAPCFADLDSDGDYDLLIGASSGDTYAYENSGSKSNPVWTKKPAWNAPSLVELGTIRASPCLADLDNDGDYDLLIGARDGIAYAYENIAPLAGAKPDLIPNVLIPPSSVTVSTPCTISATINNTGTADVDAFVTTLAVDGVVVDTQGVSGPVAGSSSTVNFTWTPEAADDYNLMVTADPENRIAESDETNNAMTATVTVSAASASPIADFIATPTYGDFPLTVQFTDESTESPTSWTWDIENDGTIDSTEQSPSFTYTAAGTYTVNLTVSNADGSDSEVKTDYIVVSASETLDTTKPVIESVVLFPANTTAGSTINISANITDDVEVTEVKAGEVQLTKTDGIWQGSITAPSSVGNYSLSINATDASGNIAETSVPYSVVKLSGGANIAVSPRSSSIVAVNNVSLSIKVKNTQNIDDTFKVRVSVSELPASYQADLAWFDWTEKVVTLKSGGEILIPMEVTVSKETSAGSRLFRANINSETSAISGFDTGYLVIS